MEHSLGHRQGALTDLDAQQQFALGIDRRPHPARRTRELLNGLGFTHCAISHRTEHRVEFIELDLLERQLAQEGVSELWIPCQMATPNS